MSFSDTMGAELVVFPFAFGGTGQVLGVFASDASLLRMDFTQHVNSLELAFGNDFTAGTRAWLLVLNGQTVVKLDSVPVNGDGVVNQTISFSGAEFNVAAFWSATTCKGRRSIRPKSSTT